MNTAGIWFNKKQGDKMTRKKYVQIVQVLNLIKGFAQ